MVLTDFLTEVADAIRDRLGEEGRINAVDFPKKILEITTGDTAQSIGKAYDSGVYYGEKDVRLARSQYSYTYLTIPHSLGRTPRAVYFGYDYTLEGGGDTPYIAASSSYQSCAGLTKEAIGDAYVRKYQTAARSYNSNGGEMVQSIDSDEKYTIITADDGYFYIHGVDSTSCTIPAGTPYRWIVF